MHVCVPGEMQLVLRSRDAAGLGNVWCSLATFINILLFSHQLSVAILKKVFSAFEFRQPRPMTSPAAFVERAVVPRTRASNPVHATKGTTAGALYLPLSKNLPPYYSQPEALITIRICSSSH
ncbi:unnamed protein product [Leptosia nina]|uniref:Uncharacterized protein n=1 Tax=Leptosia nina TaxID=320188 RepID=A0AAV1JPX2_9NEOP